MKPLADAYRRWFLKKWFRFYKDSHTSLFVKVGPWACRYSWSRGGRFANGSRWSSGWHNWRRELEEEERLYG